MTNGAMPPSHPTTPGDNSGAFTAPFSGKAGWHKGFWSLMGTQFQGAFNDNALKFLVIYLVVARDFQPAIRDRLVLLVGALFALPFIFFIIIVIRV